MTACYQLSLLLVACGLVILPATWLVSGSLIKRAFEKHGSMFEDIDRSAMGVAQGAITFCIAMLYLALVWGLS